MKLKDLCEQYNIHFTKGHVDETLKRISKDYEIVKISKGDYNIIRELSEEEKKEKRKYKKRTITTPRVSLEEIKKRCKNMNLQMLDESEYGGKITKISVIDNDGYKYKWNTSYLYKLTGNIKARISKSNPYTVENANLWLNLHNIDAKLLSFDWSGTRPFAIGLCKCGNTYRVKWSGILNGKITRLCCEECKKNIPNPRKYSYDFVKQTLLNNGYILLDNEYKGNNDNLTCINKDGYKVKIKFSEIMNQLNKSPYIFSSAFNLENYIYNINNYFKLNNIDCKALRYRQDSEKYNGNYPIVICRCFCGKEFETCYNGIKDGQYRCHSCTSTVSKIEMKVKRWLESKNIDFEMQKTFKDLKDKKPLRFDFYLPKYNYCIEVDGSQHDEIVPFSYDGMSRKEYLKSEKALEKLNSTKLHDKMKEEYCNNKNIKLIRIPSKSIEGRSEEYKKILYNNLIKK